jgi:hypothetical protein
MKVLKTTKRLSVKLDDDELLERGKQLVANMRKVAIAEEERKSEDKKRKGDIALLEGVTARLAGAISQGQEEREVECEIRKDYATNNVTVIRMDTGEVVENTPMDAADRQEQMFEQTSERAPTRGKGSDPFE